MADGGFDPARDDPDYKRPKWVGSSYPANLRWKKPIPAERMNEIAERVAEGLTLYEVAKEMDVGYFNLCKFITMDPHRERAYEEALRVWADSLAQQCVAIADGSGDVARDKLKVDIRMRLAAQWDRNRYGQKMEVIRKNDEPQTPEAIRDKIKELEDRLGVRTIKGEATCQPEASISSTT